MKKERIKVETCKDCQHFVTHYALRKDGYHEIYNGRCLMHSLRNKINFDTKKCADFVKVDRAKIKRENAKLASVRLEEIYKMLNGLCQYLRILDMPTKFDESLDE